MPPGGLEKLILLNGDGWERGRWSEERREPRKGGSRVRVSVLGTGEMIAVLRTRALLRVPLDKMYVDLVIRYYSVLLASVLGRLNMHPAKGLCKYHSHMNIPQYILDTATNILTDTPAKTTSALCIKHCEGPVQSTRSIRIKREHSRLAIR